MPTASTESTEKKGLGEAQTPIKQAIAIVEKKVRNLEKRKNKLDLIKQKAASGCKLEADQRIAIERYDEVVQTLEYSRELQKQFAAISNEAGKLMKKQARREKLDRQHHEIKRIQEMLKVQNLLDSLGTDEIRSDFQTGKHGAVVLTEENLNHLDELYQLISPTREGDGEYHVKLNIAADHIVSLLEGKNKEVIGTTYKDLKELIDLISGCGYFEVVQKLENEAVKSTDAADAATEEQVEGSTEVASSEDGKSESQTDDAPMDLPVNQMPQETLEQVAPPQLNNMAAPADPAYYTNEVYPQAPCQRPIDEIVSAVQGSFNFLQESTIDVDSVAHTDPAVVAAQPMSRQSSQPTPDSESRPHSGFGNQTYDRQTDQANNQTSQLSSNNRADQQQRYTTSDQNTHSQQNMDYPSSQPFRQNALSQNESSLFPPPGEDASQISHGMMNQTGQDNSLAQFDIPPSIPLPQSQDNQQSNITNQSEKKFTMNAAAPVFQSMYSTQQGGQEQGGDGSNHFGQNSEGSGGNYQNNRYQSDGFQQRGQRREGGGYRNNRGGRGGNGGGSNSNMQNGFNNRNSSGGGGQNSGRGGRGGSYQGYPPRNNYQPDGYQGYNSNSGGGFNQGYKQRSGNGSNQGQMRGSGGLRGSGGMRGGQTRGGGTNNTQRGGSGPRGGSQNFARAASAQYQQ